MKTLNALSRWALHLIGSVQLVAAIVFIWLDPTRQPPVAPDYPFTRAGVAQANKAAKHAFFQPVMSPFCANDTARNDSLLATSHLLATCPEAAPTNRFFSESADDQRAENSHFMPESVGQNR